MLRIVKENYSLVEVIMISAISEIETAVQAMKHGAYHYITKDFDYDQLRSLVRNASERQDLNRQVLTLSAQVADQTEREFIVGPSKMTRDIVDLVHKIAKLSATVLILGESGTGKELLARLIHREAGDPDAPFIAVNLAAIPRELAESTLFGHERGAFTGAHRQQLGKFELASNGTLFLDEIGDLRLDLQAKLLRAIQEGEIERVGGTKPIKTEFRLIAATNVDLEKAVKEGRFREDLYYRINVIPIKLPPLRERTDDIPQLAEFFLRRYNARFRKRIQGITDSTMTMLKKYWWPGNIRELENLIERLVAVSDKDYISEEDLPLEFHFAQLEPQGARTDEPVRGRDEHVRAKLHPARAREVRLERHGHGRVPWNSAEHAEIQDGQARRASARAAAARRLNIAARKLACPAKRLPALRNPLTHQRLTRDADQAPLAAGTTRCPREPVEQTRRDPVRDPHGSLDFLQRSHDRTPTRSLEHALQLRARTRSSCVCRQDRSA